MPTRPLVGVIACRREVEGHPSHMVTDKYLSALRDYGLTPVVLPVWEDIAPAEIEALTSRLDGLVLTGSHTNVEPQRYGAERAPENTRADLDRDALALALVSVALERRLPLLGICRGFQEINVALGGSLYQAVQNQPGKLDHREPEGDKATRYAPVHDLDIQPGGVLSRLFEASRSRVNSLHQQGIDRLADGLTAEAVAPDGLVEAVSVTEAEGFTLAVQWHPEWQPREHPLYDAIFRGFAKACEAYHGQVAAVSA
ncbi:gamma-glutamyl-gamma-aminobutyrate hydrolase family protein [Halomonas elongata]|uniref:gamma-glutamyl-gamma-aminobutyrate hydrolase n=2 Tax=Halomonas elongata TaxID=2746 RepID=E1V912_HALED|nr:gamma-glutamyl-gamma-aminobutyrate hydrolase family protein [Halomonas elongata]MBW5801581.1 gamma-glutamyl-gamma-aminobutyrate hydrolase family protein [Halomonas elongata]MDL4864355.1 gamma-glutamyl-gamma-aminobutyrate hydrolase family protein [Halomonas elongata]OBX37299.1 gamma-glutamyl-gamma-aminobutyrate hydrolase PuuD [Halomonas elongata]RAW07154.1 gamma-glutamyl-gamma-aminobutyrate hydrolase [Halomonas elongata]WBF19031.1 gamma-glutamyl-gamma-aminobutyrate hydrolase family protein [